MYSLLSNKDVDVVIQSKLTLQDVGNFLCKLAEKSEDVYWLSTANFEEIRYVSPAYEKIWGRARREIYRDPPLWTTFLYSEDIQAYHPLEAMRQRIVELGGDARYEESYRIIRPNGEIRWILDRGFPIMNEQGECVGVTGVATDITQQKQFEATLKKAKENAEASSEAKTEFIMNMRHDFRTPFSGILGLAGAMVQEETDPEKQANLACIAESARVLLKLHNEVFDLAALEDGLSPILDKRFDVRQLLEEQYSIQQPYAKEKSLDFTVVCGEDVPQFVFGDENRLRHILVNLLSNALKFTQKGSVSLTLSVAQQELRTIILKFTVKDTGIGMPKSQHNVIYERFTRLTSAYQGRYQGLGCGLRFVKRYVDDLDGEIVVDSEENVGTTFEVLIPFKLPLLYQSLCD